MNGFCKSVSVYWRAQFRERHPIRDGMDHFQYFGMMFDAPITEMRQHALLDDGAVEVTACNVHAATGIHFAITRITQAYHGEIERTSTKVKDDDILRFGNCRVSGHRELF